ncbi:hypothetical protein HPP92_019495 [Vanilla planifolia]|uniref:NmrA-like domain-containing protein n=1 Tax=Vanilla planifolia TaxID=51239 RepID=A0A835Q713_VANPL|nr:hypothetical protein HPP92_019495 [Vanilla planifolia]
MASTKSKILILGGTGWIGQCLVRASARAGHPTFALIRESSAASNPAKEKLLEEFRAAGVNIVYGDYNNHDSLVKAIKEVDVLISSLGHDQLPDQHKIYAAVKEAGNVKRFFPSEFGNDVDNVHAVEPAKSMFEIKVQMRRILEKDNIPYTIVVGNFTSGYFLPSLGEAGPWSPPTERVIIMGDGNAKVIFNLEEDIGTFTIKAVDDPRTLNKILYIRPHGNIYSQNELISLWEKKTGKKLERVYVPEEEVLKQIQEAPEHRKIPLSIHHTAFVKGDHTNFEIDPSYGLEASQLYPDVKYTTVDEFLDRLI